MSFKQFLLEAKEKSQYKKEISRDEAINFLKENCNNMDFKNPVWRGMDSTNPKDFYLIEGQLGERRSANTSNHYTLILDEQIKKLGTDYPLRSKSIICGTDGNKNYASNFGDLYAIFPFNDIKIGICPQEDIWHTDTIFEDLGTYELLIGALSLSDIPDKTYKEMVNYIENNEQELFEEFEEEGHTELADYLFKKSGDIQRKLKELFNIESFKFVTNKDKAISNGTHECWISGKCIAISEKEYKEILKNNFSN